MGRWIRVSIVVGGILFGLAGRASALPSNCKVGTNVYYIDSVSGSDSNSQAQAKSESTPWAHQPYMHSFTGTYTHTAGDCFIFRGGDKWNAGTTDYFNIAAGGTSSAVDYYGVDPTWFSGSSWNRPIFDVQGDLPNGNPSQIFGMGGSVGWVTFDNLEVTHGTCAASHAQYYFPINKDGITVTNSYFHAFETPSGGCGSAVEADGNQIAVWIFEQVGSAGGCDGSFDHNVVDGSDGTGAQGYEVIVYDPSNCQPIYDNVVHDICSAFGGNFSLAYGNLIYNFGGAIGKFDCISQGIHPHAIRSNYSATIYDNVIHDADDGYIKVNTGFSGSTTNSSYIFDNVEFHNADSWFAVEECDYGSGCNAGHLYIWNNTFDCTDSDLCIRIDSPISSLWIANEHHISTSGGSGITGSSNAGSYTYTASQNVYQTYAQADADLSPQFDQATSSQIYAYSPTASTNSTVGIGANLTSNWPSGIPTNDTNYACSQGTVNGVVQVVCPARASNPRPQSGAWDAGAYYLGSGTQSGQPTPPTALVATVQ
jgi:hypothetical protein